jgi:D-arabinose 1-dehydrogenase-like Zn-dependent alcohol dehydrogenase
VIAGATTGDASRAELQRIFYLQLSVLGSTMGTREELADLLSLCVRKDIRPQIGMELPLTDAEAGFRALLEGETAGKIVFTRP